MILYRIERVKYIETVLKGIGAASRDGFRWNSLGTFVVYASESRALAVLEITAHLDLSEDLPTDRCIVEIKIPDQVEILTLNPKDLPDDWDSKPPIRDTQYIGDDFINSGTAPILKVPSCIIPGEYNFLINPNHDDSKSIVIRKVSPFGFDKRLKIVAKRK